MEAGKLGPHGGVVPHISLNGADRASSFHQRAFGARELARVPAQDGKRLMHCHLEINGGSLMINAISRNMVTNRRPPTLT